jgi:hypothetical protein
VDRAKGQLAISNRVTAQFVRHDLPGLIVMVSQKETEKPFSSSAIRPLDQPDPLPERVAKATSIDNLTN